MPTESRNAKSLVAAIAILACVGCMSTTGNPVDESLIGTWKYSYKMISSTSIHFQNNGVRSTRSLYREDYELDSTSCYPDFSSMDSLGGIKGEWIFYPNKKFENRSIFPFPFPVGNTTHPVEYDSSTHQGDYEIKGDTLKLIFSRIEDEYAWELRLLKFNPQKDSLYILDPIVSYVDGDCSIAKYDVEPLEKIRP